MSEPHNSRRDPKARRPDGGITALIAVGGMILLVPGGCVLASMNIEAAPMDLLLIVIAVMASGFALIVWAIPRLLSHWANRRRAS